jgi:hypothetical protein
MGTPQQQRTAAEARVVCDIAPPPMPSMSAQRRVDIFVVPDANQSPLVAATGKSRRPVTLW